MKGSSDDRELLVWEDFPLCVIRQKRWKIEQAIGAMHTVQLYSDVRELLVWKDFPVWVIPQNSWQIELAKGFMHTVQVYSDVRGFLGWEDFPLRHPGGPSLVASVSNHLASRRTITCCKQIPTKVYSLNRQLSLTFENYGNSLRVHRWVGLNHVWLKTPDADSFWKILCILRTTE